MNNMLLEVLWGMFISETASYEIYVTNLSFTTTLRKENTVKS